MAPKSKSYKHSAAKSAPAKAAGPARRQAPCVRPAGVPAAPNSWLHAAPVPATTASAGRVEMATPPLNMNPVENAVPAKSGLKRPCQTSQARVQAPRRAWPDDMSVKELFPPRVFSPDSDSDEASVCETLPGPELVAKHGLLVATREVNDSCPVVAVEAVPDKLTTSSDDQVIPLTITIESPKIVEPLGFPLKVPQGLGIPPRQILAAAPL